MYMPGAFLVQWTAKLPQEGCNSIKSRLKRTGKLATRDAVPALANIAIASHTHLRHTNFSLQVVFAFVDTLGLFPHYGRLHRPANSTSVIEDYDEPLHEHIISEVAMPWCRHRIDIDGTKVAHLTVHRVHVCRWQRQGQVFVFPDRHGALAEGARPNCRRVPWLSWNDLPRGRCQGTCSGTGRCRATSCEIGRIGTDHARRRCHPSH